MNQVTTYTEFPHNPIIYNHLIIVIILNNSQFVSVSNNNIGNFLSYTLFDIPRFNLYLY